MKYVPTSCPVTNGILHGQVEVGRMVERSMQEMDCKSIQCMLGYKRSARSKVGPDAPPEIGWTGRRHRLPSVLDRSFVYLVNYLESTVFHAWSTYNCGVKMRVWG
jgi:hypothetical protein